MKTFTAVLLATLLGIGATAAHADDNTAKQKSAKTPVAAAATPAPAAAPVQMSQQDKMRQCSKDATGKKGAERKDFMKTCLSKKKT
ncbi:MAG: PsiF family protein [Casimicrobiaceae bacterium]